MRLTTSYSRVSEGTTNVGQSMEYMIHVRLSRVQI